ncbi:ankyrin repeat domain-containing protein [Aspergillus udagawae]|uniref:Uncharacterized protein n=1 Tax=Aspergillus udagawae TaxID=91492 RepID=A0A8E0V2B7_9EURO|nr:uncharacterized protein Aud_001825 [Aspergillus udagawae]GIC94497.1 hypothetical protein Aud_001825 [Aspergillus udagawae]
MVMVERVQVLLYSVRTTLASKVCDCTGLEWVKNILFLRPLKDVENGRLYQSMLDQYKARENFDIGGIDPKRGLTTLAIAALKGQTHVVRLLLYNGASACKLFKGDRGPLWFAPAGRMHRKDRSDIIRLLLDSKAEIDRPSPVNGNYTPLMKILVEWKDPEIVSQLVDAGASLTVTNENGEGVRDIAEKINDAALNRALLSKEDRQTKRGDFVSLIVKLVYLIVHYINGGDTTDIVQSIISDLYHISGQKSPEIAKVGQGYSSRLLAKVGSTRRYPKPKQWKSIKTTSMSS